MYRTEVVCYSIIIPVFNSEDCLQELISKINKVMSGVIGDYEIVLVNDASFDNSWGVICDLKKSFARIKGINLACNAGQSMALLCGVKHAKGEYIITIDDDLQNPPEEIPKLIDMITSDKDLNCVFGIAEEKKHSFVRNLGSIFFTFSLGMLFPENRKIKRSNFRIFTRDISLFIVDNMHYGANLSAIIFKGTTCIKNVFVTHNIREHGNSNYNIRKLIALTIDNIIVVSSLQSKLLFCGIFVVFCFLNFFVSRCVFVEILMLIFLCLFGRFIWLILQDKKENYLIDSII